VDCVEMGGSATGRGGAMSIITRKNQRGFTLIELLAVMAIVAVLAGIISVAVSGTGGTSRDTQTKQDATTVQTAAADFFAAPEQEGAEVLVPKTVTVLSRPNIRQVTSSRWPEDYISDRYSAVFLDEIVFGAPSPTVNSILLLTGEDSVTPVTIRQLLENFNALDFDALIAGDFTAVEPDSATSLSSGLYNNYLWLLEKTSAAGGSGPGAERQVAVSPSPLSLEQLVSLCRRPEMLPGRERFTAPGPGLSCTYSCLKTHRMPIKKSVCWLGRKSHW